MSLPIHQTSFAMAAANSSVCAPLVEAALAAAVCESESTYLTGEATLDILLSVFLLLLSGLFSGLTLGLMSLDVNGLEIIEANQDTTDAGYARTILPLRRKGNLLLCTLLLGNTLVRPNTPLLKHTVALLCIPPPPTRPAASMNPVDKQSRATAARRQVNALIAILSASFTSGIVGALLSTGFIVIFGHPLLSLACRLADVTAVLLVMPALARRRAEPGPHRAGEITPQSICSRYGLMIGAHTIWIVKFFMLLLYPVAWPISAVLDCALGEEMGTIYTKKELAKLVELHAKADEADVTAADADRLKGALQFPSVKVGDIMTSHTGVYILDVNGTLGFDTMLEMYRRGHTRVPVCDGSALDPRSPIVGLLLTKDLMLVDPADDLSIRALLQFCGREIRSVPESWPLDKMLDMMKGEKTHLFFVQPAAEFEAAVQKRRATAPDSSASSSATTSSNPVEGTPLAELPLAGKGVQVPLHGVTGIVTLEDVLEELSEPATVFFLPLRCTSTDCIAAGSFVKSRADCSSVRDQRRDGYHHRQQHAPAACAE